MVLLVDPFIKSENYMVCNEDQGRNKPLIDLLSLQSKEHFQSTVLAFDYLCMYNI